MKKLHVANSITFTRPANTTQYASGDLVANDATAASVVPPQVSVVPLAGLYLAIKRIQLIKSTTSVTTPAFRVHFYTVKPTVTNGDNGAWISPKAGYLGSIDVTADRAHSDGASGFGANAAGSEIIAVPATGRLLWLLIEARATYTPGSSETFTVRVESEYESTEEEAD